jgi:hypothetical protein
MITIRGFIESDYSELISILKEENLFDITWDSLENIKGILTYDPQSVLIALNNNKVIGSLFIVPYGAKVAYLFRLTVKILIEIRG